MIKIILTITILLASFTIYLFQPVKTSQIVYIPKGSIKTILSSLPHKDYAIPFIDRHLVAMMGILQQGFLDLGNTKFSKIDFLYKLTTAKGALLDITAIPGDSTYYFLKEVSKKLHLNFDTMFDYYNKKALYGDGVIFADTYRLNMNMNEKNIVDFLISKSMKKHKYLAYKYLGKYDEKKWFKYVIKASIIQKEAADKEEMRIISSVIDNRLKKYIPLQMDGSLGYGKFSHTKITKHRILTDNTRFNTYKYRKLPLSPVCIIQESSVYASIFPIKTNYLYFVINPKTKKHIFTKTLKKHMKYVKIL